MSEKLPVPGVYFQPNPYGRVPHLLRPLLIEAELEARVDDLTPQACWCIYSVRDFSCTLSLDVATFGILPRGDRAGTTQLRVLNTAQYELLTNPDDYDPDSLRFAKLFDYCNRVAGRHDALPQDKVIVVVADSYLL